MYFANTLVLRPHNFGALACQKQRAATPCCRHAALDVCGAAIVTVGQAA